jgi:hypothetical protein
MMEIKGRPGGGTRLPIRTVLTEKKRVFVSELERLGLLATEPTG